MVKQVLAETAGVIMATFMDFEWQLRPTFHRSCVCPRVHLFDLG